MSSTWRCGIVQGVPLCGDYDVFKREEFKSRLRQQILQEPGTRSDGLSSSTIQQMDAVESVVDVLNSLPDINSLVESLLDSEEKEDEEEKEVRPTT